MNDKVTIIIIAHNEEKFIEPCLNSLLNQSYKLFEIVVVDSCSSDKTAAIVKRLAASESRIKYIYTPDRGFALPRNTGLELANTPYVFFIDADCIAVQDWLVKGIESLSRSDILGVSGRTYYVSREYRPSVRDKVVYNKKGEVYPTCNIALKSEAVLRVGGFRARYNEGLEDWDLVFRLMECGKVIFSQEMLVYHQKKAREIGFSLDNFGRARNVVRLVKDYYGHRYLPHSYVLARIILPLQFFIIFFPPLLFIYYLGARRFNILRDGLFIFADYFNCVMVRLVIWKTA